jgi:L-ascorbate metabolism protein UlaG (beta-lactamase superfamily)
VKRFRLTSPILKLKENDVEDACVDYLRRRGYKVTRNHIGRFMTPDGRWITMGETGYPDWTALHGQQIGFLLEVKRPGGKLSPEQVKKIREIRLGDRLAVVVVDDVQALIDWLPSHEAKATARGP